MWYKPLETHAPGNKLHWNSSYSSLAANLNLSQIFELSSGPPPPVSRELFGDGQCRPSSDVVAEAAREAQPPIS